MKLRWLILGMIATLCLSSLGMATILYPPYKSDSEYYISSLLELSMIISLYGSVFALVTLLLLVTAFYYKSLEYSYVGFIKYYIVLTTFTFVIALFIFGVEGYTLVPLGIAWANAEIAGVLVYSIIWKFCTHSNKTHHVLS
ncbi:MAG: hypothetical protein N4A46_16985 [Schleiferiaceae bacterium]|jgi:uncharacterized membrane protein|nr:hypothetical protein [Schleiferiaceae bacterium]